MHGFWPETIRPVDNMASLVRPNSRRDKNEFLKSKAISPAMMQDFCKVRGVELFLDDTYTLDNYDMVFKEGALNSTSFKCPVPCVRTPGELRVAWYMQSKGHWFWAFYRDESSGNLVVKWVRGRVPVDDVRWLNCNNGNLVREVGSVGGWING